MAPLRLADLAQTSGDYATAEALMLEGLARAAADDIPWIRAKILRALGYVQLRRDDLSGAQRLFQQSLAEARRFDDARGISQRLDGLASVAVAGGQTVHAARLFGAADGLRARLGTVSTGFFVGAPTEWSDRLYAANECRAQIDADWSAGRSLPLEQAIAEALELCVVGNVADGPIRAVRR